VTVLHRTLDTLLLDPAQSVAFFLLVLAVVTLALFVAVIRCLAGASIQVLVAFLSAVLTTPSNRSVGLRVNHHSNIDHIIPPVLKHLSVESK
jgi:hypothetical protein